MMDARYNYKVNDALLDIRNELKAVKERHPEHITNGLNTAFQADENIRQLIHALIDDDMIKQRKMATETAGLLLRFLVELM